MKFRKIIPVIFLLGTVAASGCTWIGEQIQEVAVKPAVTMGIDKRVGPVNLDTYGKDGTNGKATYENPGATKDDRSRLQGAIIVYSHGACSEFRMRLFAIHGARKVLFQGSALLLSGAATAVTGNVAKTVLSALSAGVLGTDETIDAHFLQNAAITGILNTITSERKQALIDMRQKQGREITEYSVQAAVADAVRYNRLCSLTEAISIMSNATQKKNMNANVIKNIAITNARIRLQSAQGKLDRAEEKKAAVADSPAFKTLEVRVERLKTEVERLQGELDGLMGATSEEVTEGIAAPETKKPAENK